MKPRVFIETTIPSYLTAWPSAGVVRAAHQQLTKEWWARREEYELFTSQFVIDECGAGDAQAAAARLLAMDGRAVLGQVAEITVLAKSLVAGVPLPQKATGTVSQSCEHFANDMGHANAPRIQC
jgi:hypothetical protein